MNTNEWVTDGIEQDDYESTHCGTQHLRWAGMGSVGGNFHRIIIGFCHSRLLEAHLPFKLASLLESRIQRLNTKTL